MKHKLTKQRSPIRKLRSVVATLRSPEGCPWDREQDHASIRLNAIEEVYELIDAIEAVDDLLLQEELGDLLLQVVFHCQIASERGAFDFDRVCEETVRKLIRRHPHVFGQSNAKTVEAVWTQWEKIKRAEKTGTHHERHSAFDGIPRHLPSLLRAEKLIKKARKAGLPAPAPSRRRHKKRTRGQIAAALFELVREAQEQGWSAEALLRSEIQRQEKRWRRLESAAQRSAPKQKN